jgi:RimJ/RimL family protein N-acetyltransferase
MECPVIAPSTTTASPFFPDLTRDDVFRLETRRLWLRWPRLADKAAIIAQAGEKAVASMTGTIPHPYPDAAADPYIFNARKGNAIGEQLALAITLKGRPNEVIGMVTASLGTGVAGKDSTDKDGTGKDSTGKNTASKRVRPVLGYWLGLDHWGNGFATEATQAIIDAVFTFTDADDIDADARVINPSSRRVLEKCGFRHEGSALKALSARGGLYPCDQFRLDRSTWVALKAWGMAAMPEFAAASSGSQHRSGMQRFDDPVITLALPWSGGLCPA